MYREYTQSASRNKRMSSCAAAISVPHLASDGSMTMHQARSDFVVCEHTSCDGTIILSWYSTSIRIKTWQLRSAEKAHQGFLFTTLAAICSRLMANTTRSGEEGSVGLKCNVIHERNRKLYSEVLILLIYTY